MNNDMLPVGTTFHINPEDINKWEQHGGDLISRSALKKLIKSYADDQYAENEYLGECAIMDIIDNAPAVESTRPKGKWIRYRDEPHQPEHIKCSNCGQYWSIADHDKTFDFCFKCGAYMRGKEE